LVVTVESDTGQFVRGTTATQEALGARGAEVFGARGAEVFGTSGAEVFTRAKAEEHRAPRLTLTKARSPADKREEGTR
jgi:hypothetical protein